VKREGQLSSTSPSSLAESSIPPRKTPLDSSTYRYSSYPNAGLVSLT